jgi:hypothetical protein
VETTGRRKDDDDDEIGEPSGSFASSSDKRVILGGDLEGRSGRIFDWERPSFYKKVSEDFG